MTAPPAVVVDSLQRTFGSGEARVTALDGVSLELASGSFTAVMGPSGSGKTTLLQCAAGLDRPTAGSVRLGGVELGPLNEAKRTVLRRQRIGFVFQAFNLLPALTVAQNIELPLRLSGTEAEPAWRDDVIARCGLGARLKHRPAELSGGQQQRVAVARALITRPEVIFADEPTGALDSTSGAEVLALLREAVDATGGTVVIVTHDPITAAYADEVVFLADGRLAGRQRAPTPDVVAERLAHLGA
jgi:putative ABC transport system ATP-binding protein